MKANESLPQTLERILGKKLDEGTESELQAAEQVRINPEDASVGSDCFYYIYINIFVNINSGGIHSIIYFNLVFL